VITQADGGKIMHQRGPQHRSRGVEGRNTRDDLDEEINRSGWGILDSLFANTGRHFFCKRQPDRVNISFAAEVKHQPGHSIDAGIAAGHQGHALARQSSIDGRRAAFHLLAHAAGQDLLALGEVRDELQIELVAHHHFGSGQGLESSRNQVPLETGAQAYDGDSTRATATVALAVLCLGTRIRLCPDPMR